MIRHPSSLRIAAFNWAQRSPETLDVDQKSIFPNYVHNVVSRGTPREVGGAISGSAGEGEGGEEEKGEGREGDL